MIKQALIGLTAAALLAGCGGEDKAQAPAAKAADGTKTVGLVQLVEHPALDAASRGIQDAVKARGLKLLSGSRFYSRTFPPSKRIESPAGELRSYALCRALPMFGFRCLCRCGKRKKIFPPA